MSMNNNLEIAKHYLTALEQGADTDTMADFFSTDFVQVEFPNRLTPNGAERDLTAIARVFCDVLRISGWKNRCATQL
jgi:ketosteroid isomerase-like protein